MTTIAPNPVSQLEAFEKLPPELQLKLLRIRKARMDSSAFNSYCFVDKEGNSWVQRDFQESWHKACEMYSKVQIEAFREAAKTEQISIGRTLYRLGKNPNLRVKVVSADDDLAKAIIAAAGEHIKSNERLHEVFPNLKPAEEGEWNSQRLFVQRTITMKDASLSAHGVLSSGVGGRCDLLIFDDVCNFRNTVLQPAMKRLVVRAVETVWMKLVTPDGQIIWLDTPWAPDDASSVVRSYEDFEHLKYPIYKKVRSRSTGQIWETSRWPEKYPDDWLAKERRARSVSFKTQYLLDTTVSSGDAYFGESAIYGCRSSDVPGLGPPEPGHIYVSFWDLGRHVNKKGRNASICVTLDITGSPAYIRNVSSYVDVPYLTPNLEEYCVGSEIVRIAGLYHGETVVESNAAGEAVIEGLPIAVTPFRTTVATKTPMIQNLLNVMTSEDIKWNYDDEHEELERMELQLKTYTLQDDNIAQDYVIALSGAALFIGTEGGSGVVI